MKKKKDVQKCKSTKKAVALEQNRCIGLLLQGGSTQAADIAARQKLSKYQPLIHQTLFPAKALD